MNFYNLIKENNPGKNKIFIITTIFFVITIFNLIPVYFQRIIFDKVIPAGDLKGLTIILIGILFSNFISLILNIFQDYISSVIGERLIYDLKANVINKLFKLKEIFYENRGSGELNRIFDDTLTIGDTIKSFYVDIIKNVIIFTIYLPIMMFINLWLAILKFLPFLFVYFFGKYFGCIDRKYEKEIWQQSSLSYSRINEVVNGYKSIKLYKMDNFFSNKLKLINLNIKKFSIYRKFFQYLWSIIGNQFDVILNSIIFFISTYLIINNKLTFGSYIFFNVVSNSAINSLSEIFNIFKKILMAKNPILRYYEIINSEELNNKEQNTTVIENNIENNGKENLIKNQNITFKNVYFKYKDKFVLKNINLVLEKNKKIAIVGSSGSGKSTIVKLLLGFYENYEGKIFIGNRELRTINKDELRNYITMVMQDPFFFNGTIKENIVPRNKIVRDFEIYNALKITNSLDFIGNLPERLNTYIGTGGVNLSGGQKQRLSIVRAILSKCPIIVFDEATSGLDPINDKIISDYINNYSKNKTIISIVHKLNTIQDYDLIYVIDNGEIVESGTHSNLIEIGGLYYELYRNIKCS